MEIDLHAIKSVTQGCLSLYVLGASFPLTQGEALWRRLGKEWREVSSFLADLRSGERRELPKRGSGQSPGERRI